ncbi:MAG: Flp pilus assembly complex ATPase component TadA, partial [Candidatus Latescibacteria bacterium]|nr:Flp pilus assembly complex ATPase component TadA [Candidatus Latescibacterota bacterium]
MASGNREKKCKSGLSRGAYRIGDFLKEKGRVDAETIEQAIAIQRERPEPPGGGRQRLGDILTEDLGVDRHLVYQSLAELYGFREVHIEPKTMEEERLGAVRELLDRLPDEVRTHVLHKRVIPFPEGPEASGTLQILAADPTEPFIETLASRLGHRKYEAAYVRLEVLDELIDRIAPPKNEFLELIEEATQAEVIEEEERVRIDEEALDAEINQSLLGSLVEGSLVEAVRRGVSDIHIVPREGNRVEFHFREDGKLYLWHTQEGTKPEAVSAVLKDRAINVDRFERERAQDGFIQRKIDGHLLRFRVSVLPIVGQEFERKLESVVIRILDDRKVITDLEKLGLQGKTQEAFVQSIKKPQGIVILTGPTGSGKST